jgi:excisionase family DNA binding protein
MAEWRDGKALGKYVLTTGQVADVVGVAQRTVTGWCDNGHLPFHRLPRTRGTQAEHRRILVDDLVAFCHKHGMVHALARLPARTALFAGVAPTPLPGWRSVSVANLTELGWLSQGARVAVVGPLPTRGDPLIAVAWLCRQSGAPAVLGVPGEDDGDTERWREAGCGAVLARPYAPEELAMKVAGLLGEG